MGRVGGRSLRPMRADGGGGDIRIDKRFGADAEERRRCAGMGRDAPRPPNRARRQAAGRRRARWVPYSHESVSRQGGPARASRVVARKRRRPADHRLDGAGIHRPSGPRQRHGGHQIRGGGQAREPGRPAARELHFPWGQPNGPVLGRRVAAAQPDPPQGQERGGGARRRGRGPDHERHWQDAALHHRRGWARQAARVARLVGNRGAHYAMARTRPRYAAGRARERRSGAGCVPHGRRYLPSSRVRYLQAGSHQSRRRAKASGQSLRAVAGLRGRRRRAGRHVARLQRRGA